MFGLDQPVIASSEPSFKMAASFSNLLDSLCVKFCLSRPSGTSGETSAESELPKVCFIAEAWYANANEMMLVYVTPFGELYDFAAEVQA